MNRRLFLTSLTQVAAAAALFSVTAQENDAPRKSTINRARCVGCGDCIRACPVQAISFDRGKAHVDQEKCIGCHLCIATCSYGAPR